MRWSKPFRFEPIRQKGSHVVLKKKTSDTSFGCVVPLHKELKICTMKSILKMAQISESEFLEKTEKKNK